jgi:ankyrin repeat protein
MSEEVLLFAEAYDIDLIKYFMEEERTDINEFFTLLRNPGGEEEINPILWRAALDENVRVIKFLIKNGADVNVTNYDCGSTPLHEAASNNNIKIMELLLKAGADINAKDKSGRTPLEQHTAFANYKTLKFLIENGAQFDLNAKHDPADPSSITIIEYLEKVGGFEKHIELLKKAAL